MDRFEGRRLKSPMLLLAGVGALAAAVMLFQVPLATVFTIGVLLICPLLMAGMHGGHHDPHDTPRRTPPPVVEPDAEQR